jgi:hypothetical protein
MKKIRAVAYRDLKLKIGELLDFISRSDITDKVATVSKITGIRETALALEEDEE